MSKRTNAHTISHAETLYSGNAYRAGAQDGGRGIPRASLVQVDLGAPTIADPNGLFSEDSGPVTGSKDFTLDGALVTGGVATFATPRGVQIINAGASTSKITFYGTDQYGELMSEELLSNGNNIVLGKKAFKKITRVATDTDTTAALDAGDSDVLGLPFRLENVADIVVIDEDDKNVFNVTAITAAAAAVTAVNPGAVTNYAAATMTDPVTKAEGETFSTAMALLEDEVTAIRAEVVKLVTDVAAQKVELDKLIVDVTAVDTGALVKADATAVSDVTGDVRGTYNPTAVLDGTKNFKVLYRPQGRDSLTAYGLAQFRKAT